MLEKEIKPVIKLFEVFGKSCEEFKKLGLLILLFSFSQSVFSYDEYIIHAIYRPSMVSIGSIVVTGLGTVDRSPDKILYLAYAPKGTYTTFISTVGDGLLEADMGLYIDVPDFFEYVISKEALIVVDTEIDDKYPVVRLIVPQENEKINSSLNPLFYMDTKYFYEMQD